MAIYTNMTHVHQSRTIKPVYGFSQATPQAVYLDPAFTASDGDIFPGSVLTRESGGKVTLCNGTKIPAGLSGNWVAPTYGIDEIRGGAGDLEMSMWVLSPDAELEVTAPAFDTTAAWTTAKTELDAGKAVYLRSSTTGLLTLDLTGAEGSQTDNTVTVNSIARLLDVESTSCIHIGGLL